MKQEKFFVVPRNEHGGIKELRVSRTRHSVWKDGPVSGIRIGGKPIEDVEFKSASAARRAIAEHAPWLLP